MGKHLIIYAYLCFYNSGIFQGSILDISEYSRMTFFTVKLMSALVFLLVALKLYVLF